MGINPRRGEVFPHLYTKSSAFVYEKKAVFPHLYTKNRPLLTYSNKNITARSGSLNAPHCVEEEFFLFSVFSCLTKYRGRP
jgi:hypothetical protein